MINRKYVISLCLLAFAFCSGGAAFSADVEGYILDTNWYAWDVPFAQTEYCYTTAPTPPGDFGSPWYEYGVAGNRNGDETNPGFAGSTENQGNWCISDLGNYRCGEFGYFRKPGYGSGTYAMASWSRWWRPGFLFGVDYPWTLSNKPIIRIHANMLSYGASWPGNSYTPHPPGDGMWNELGQAIVATGSAITMITIRMPLSGVDFTATLHDGGPGGPQVGPSKSWTTSSGPNDKRLFYDGNDLPTIPGHTYYLKLKAAGTTKGFFCESEPIPDLSDPMPNGCIYRDGTPDPERDLGLIVCSDDDGIVTDLNIDKAGTYGTPVPQNVYRLGQTFVARGTSLVYLAAYLTNHATDFVATLYDGITGGVPGAKIGFLKKNSEVRYAGPGGHIHMEPRRVPADSRQHILC